MKKSLRILQLSNQAGPFHLFMGPLTRSLRDSGAVVEYACMPLGALWEPFSRSEQNVHVLPAGRWSNPLTWLKLYRKLRVLFREGNYDLLIVHTPVMSWIGRFAARHLVKASVYFAHGLPFTPSQPRLLQFIYRSVERFVGRFTDAVIVMNQDDAEACKKYRLTRKDGNWYRIPGVGVDLEQYSGKQYNTESIRRLENEFHLRAGKKMVLYLGRFFKSKRPGDILELARRIGPDVDFVMAGEGPLWKRISHRAADIGDHIKVTGFTYKSAELISRCSVVVMPSVFREGMPRLLLEAHCAGKPAVAYDVRGCRDVIEHGKSGYLVEPENIENLYNSVLKLLNDDDLRTKMGDNARRRIQEKFSVYRSVESIRIALREVLLKKGVSDLPLDVN